MYSFITVIVIEKYEIHNLYLYFNLMNKFGIS